MGSEGRTSLALLTVLLVATLTASVAVADQTPEPDHGVNETTFPLLWSGDHDGNVTGGGEGDNRTVAIRQLANGTDVPFNAPPKDVERWNAGEIRDFPSTNVSVSIRPTGVDTENGRFVKDAHATIFAIQPSTRARLSQDKTPLYVGTEGTVFGTLDYRVDIPEDDTTGSRQVYWTLESHRFENVRFLVDGETHRLHSPSHTQRFRFGGLDEGEHTLAIAANVSVRLQKHVRTERTICRSVGNKTECSIAVGHEFEHFEESVSLTDRVEVIAYDFDVTGQRARYPNGDLGLEITADRPWVGYETPTGNVTGTWRFYSASPPRWNELVYATNEGSHQLRSPMRPLQVNAVPLAVGASAPSRDASILETTGGRRKAPTLPENVSLGVPNGTYNGTESIVARVPGSVSTIQVRGLVRGTGRNLGVESLDPVAIHHSNLSIAVLNESGSETTVRVRLRDVETGAPINTADRDGYVVLDGTRVNTSHNGTTTVDLRRAGTVVSAQYEPGHWWRNAPGYVGDRISIKAGGPSLGVLLTLFRFAIPVGLFLLAVYFVDRITRWQIWPPWRGM